MPSSKTGLPPKTIPNPEYKQALRKNEDVRAAIEDVIAQQYVMLGSSDNPFALVDGYHHELWSAFPEMAGCEIPDEGAWIVVKDVPHTELDERFRVPPLSIWRARPQYRNRFFKVGKEGGLSRRTNIEWPCLLAVIDTPGGELWLYPGEYSTIPPERLEVYLDCIGREVQMHFLGVGDPGDLDAQLFYLMSHGIPRTEAMLLLLPDLKDSNFAYFTVEL